MRAKRIFLKLLAALCFWSAAFAAYAEPKAPSSAVEIQLSFAPIVRQAAPAVVNIYTKTLVRKRESPFKGDPFFEFFFRDFGGRGRMRERVERSLGSGVIVSGDGLVLTNAHVVRNAVEVTVALNDRREFSAAIALIDERSDLAVLRLVDAQDLPTLPFGDSDKLEVGDLVIAIGNPFGVGQTVTSGIISAQARSSKSGFFLQTDAAINPGNSGGALVDLAGRLVGVNSAILTRSGGSNGIGFAIPASLARQAALQAQKGARRLRRPWLGMAAQSVNADLAEALQLKRPQGVIITGVAPISPFKAVGLDVGWAILAVEGQPIDDMTELEFRLTSRGPGAIVDILALSPDGVRSEVSMKLIGAPETPPRDEEFVKAGPLNGLRAVNINPAVIEEMRLEASSGVVVIGVEGPARRLKLQPGDVILAINGGEVSHIGHLRDAAEQIWGLRQIDFLRDGRRLILRFRG